MCIKEKHLNLYVQWNIFDEEKRNPDYRYRWSGPFTFSSLFLSIAFLSKKKNPHSNAENILPTQ